jgi:indolepyruvate ferredoxin oxidoreductase beta subunit
VVSAVMLGAIAGSGLFPFRREDYEAVVRAGGKGAEASLRGFTRGYESVCHAGPDPASTSPRPDGLRVPGSSPGQALPAMTVTGFPEAVQEMSTLGYQRLIDYQDKAYADLYLQRLQSVLAAEREADPQAQHHHARDGTLARALDGLR